MKRSNERQKWEIREHSGICDMKRKVSSLQEKEDQPKELFGTQKAMKHITKSKVY